MFGRELRVGDTIKVWWAPGRDTIIALSAYQGRLGHLWPDGARTARFALLKSGMTCGNAEKFETTNR